MLGSSYRPPVDVNFGDVKIPKNLDYPKPQKIDALNGVHAVSSENIVVVDAQTLLIPSFSYDGEAPDTGSVRGAVNTRESVLSSSVRSCFVPDAKFWVGRGPKPSSQGVRVADENGKEDPLRRYDRKTIVLTLPGDLTVFDIGHFGVWCEAFAVDFGHIRVPGRSLNVPPSLHMLGVSPQNRELIPSTLEQSLYQQLLFNQQQQQLQQQQQQQSHHRFAVDVPFVTAADSSGNFNEQIDPSSFPEGDQSSLAAFPPSNQRTLSSPQQRVHVTTFRPTQLSTRGGKARDFKGATSVQIVPSIALSPDNSFLGRADVPQGSFQGFLANNPVPQNYFTVVESDSPAQGQASIQEVLRVRPERVQGGGGAQVLRAHPDHNHGGHSGAVGAARRHDGRSFSHLSINGAGGSSDTFVQYK
uniref:DM13 domain-containing protein n=1 Tax=Timema douglasi TaxID=61478 RepID=A0A7R8VLG6_TIMDO|nr:unnamed protein product [Timema douglasi]